MSEKQAQKLLPAYLVVGEDALKRRTVLERLRKRIAELGDFEFNHDEFDAENADGSQIAIACNTLPFASELRLVEVFNIEKLKKQDADVLVAYLAAPNQSTVLALSGEKLAKNSRLYKAVADVGKTAVIECAPLKRYELVKALRSMAVGHGFTLTEGAADALVMLVGEDTIRLDTELKKLALAHVGSDPVTEREVKTLVARTNEVKPWEFVDAFSARDLKPSRGEAAQLASVLKAPPWRVKNHVTNSRKFSDDELRRAIVSARDCERAMKSGANPDNAFKDWLIEVLAK